MQPPHAARDEHAERARRYRLFALVGSVLVLGVVLGGAGVYAAVSGAQEGAAAAAPFEGQHVSPAPALVEGPTAGSGAVEGTPDDKPVQGTAAPTIAGETRTGALGPGDHTLQTGEYVEAFTFSWNAGESHEVRLTSFVFDPYLIVRPPNGAQLENDDLVPGSSTEAGVTVACAATGAYTILVTSYRPGEAGEFTLTIR